MPEDIARDPQSPNSHLELDPARTVALASPAEIDESTCTSPSAPSKVAIKQRSLSDCTPTLSPAAKLKNPPETLRDDHSLITTPSRRAFSANTPASGRSKLPALQIPFTLPDALGSNSLRSPTFEPRESVYTSPSSVLPRHSRGMEISRAKTNLHHSTVPDRSSPEASPTLASKNFFGPSRRPSCISTMMDSPRTARSSFGAAAAEKPFYHRSYSSTNAMVSEASSDSSDEDTLMRQDESDDMVTTPQAPKFDNAGYRAPTSPWAAGHSPLARGLSHTHRTRYNKHTNKSSLLSLGLAKKQPPHDSPLQTINTSRNSESGDVQMDSAASRRGSLLMGTNGLHISSSNDSSDEGAYRFQMSTPGVVRRPVTRRSNLLPKTKGFARIRAELQEESAPVDNEVKREAEVVKQVKENDGSQSAIPKSPDLNHTNHLSNTDASDLPDMDAWGPSDSYEPFRGLAPDRRRNSTHREFFPLLYNSKSEAETPPPPLFHRPRSSSGVSEDVWMDSPQAPTPLSSAPSTSLGAGCDGKSDVDMDQSSNGAFAPPNLPTAIDMSRKAHKRCREEDFDPASIKRRAVSPGLSVQSSPVLGQSPVSNSGGWWGPQAKLNREGTGGSGSLADGSGTPVSGPKRMGMQGYSDTNDGLMKMTLDSKE